MRNLLQDLRYAVSAMLAKPAFTLIVLSALALGIGVNTALSPMFPAGR